VRPGAETERDTAPAKPKRLVIVMVDVLEPGVMENVVGLAERAKSAGGIVIAMVTNSDSWLPLIIVVTFTVTEYLPGGVEELAETVSVELAMLLASGFTIVGFKVAVGRLVIVAFDTVAERVTFWEKPPML
jgi:hypothetical protein